MKSAEMLRKILELRRPKGFRWAGLLGDFGGNVDSDRPGEVYVRLRQAGNASYVLGSFKVRGGLRHYYNLPVMIEIDPLSGEQYVAGVDAMAVDYGIAAGNDPTPTSGYIETHAATHEWRDNADDQLQWLHTLQIYPLRVQPSTTSQHVIVQGGVYYAGLSYHWLRDTIDIDLATYYPGSGRKWVLIYIDATETVGISDNGATDIVDLDNAPAGTYVMAAVKLTVGAEIAWLTDIVDLRFIGQALSTFLSLPDTPDDYAGAALYWLRVNAAENAVEFAQAEFLNLTDTPSAYIGQGTKNVAVKADETGLEFVTGGGGGSGGGDIAITFQARYWTVDGPLAVADEVGGVWRVMENFSISAVTMYIANTGDSGSTIIDIDRSGDGGATWASIFSTPANRPTVAAGAPDHRAYSVPDVTLLYAGDLVRCNIDQVAIGTRGLSAQIDGEVHFMTPTIYKVTLTSADTEYSQVLPVGTRAISFKARGNHEIRWAFETGKVAAPTDPYETLAVGQTYFKENLVAAAVTLYFASGFAGTEVEIEVWS